MLERLKPGVARHWLFGVAGLIWAGVGSMLAWIAYGWLSEMSVALAAGLAAFGIALGVAGTATVFARVSRMNIARISRAPDIACVFSFQAWEGYLVMTFMIGLGVALRHLPVPPEIKAPVYVGVGISLAASSVRYFAALTRQFS
jgi:hypothetical protein